MRIHQQADDEEQRPVRFSFCRSVQRDPQLKCLTLSLLIVLSLASVAWCRIVPRGAPPSSSPRGALPNPSPVGQCQHSGYVYFPVGLFCILYLVYLGECWHSSTHVSFRFPVDASAIYQQIRAMRLSPPIVWWRAVCYHYDRRLRQVMRYRRGDAYTSSQVFYERVNSQVTTTVFDFTHFGVVDASKRLVHLEKHPATKIRFSRKFSFACPLAEESYHQQRTEFIDEHQRIDDYLEFTEGLDLLNVRFEDQTVALSNPCHRPWYLYTWVFWAASVTLLSYPLRLIIGYKTAHVHYQVHKIFGVDRQPDFMTRILVGGDVVAGGQGVNGGQMERTIRHNLSLAPSYAEALQISSSRHHRPRFFGHDGDTAAFPSYGSIPLLPLADRKTSTASSSTAVAPSRTDDCTTASDVTGSHVTAVDDVTCAERSRRCVVGGERRIAVTQTTTPKTTDREEVSARVVNGEQERRDAVGPPLTSASSVLGDEIRPDVTSSECGNANGDVRKRRGNDSRTVGRGRQSNENPDEVAKRRRRRSCGEETEGEEEECPNVRGGKTFQEMTSTEVATRPEIAQHPVVEEEEEDEEEEDEEENGNDESSDIRRIDEYCRAFEAHRSKNRNVTSSSTSSSAVESFEVSSSFLTHLKSFRSENNPADETLQSPHSSSSPSSSLFVNHLNRRHAVNHNSESIPLNHHHHHHHHSYRYNNDAANPAGCCRRSSLENAPLATDATFSDDIDLLELVNESPPSYEDALRMRRFVLPLATGSGLHFRNHATSGDELFDDDSIGGGSPGHQSQQDYNNAPTDHGDNPSRSRGTAVVIQVMETSL